jgi:hypothetical protein
MYDVDIQCRMVRIESLSVRFRFRNSKLQRRAQLIRDDGNQYRSLHLYKGVGHVQCARKILPSRRAYG